MAKESAKAAKFVQEYMVDLNATKAAIRAGYAPASAAVSGSRLLRSDKIRAQLNSAIAEQSRRTEITADKVLQEIYRVATSDIARAFGPDGKLLSLHEMPSEARAALAGVETEELFEGHGDERVLSGLSRKIRHWDKVRALELLGKHLGLFRDKVELSGKDGDALVVEVRTYKGET